jgi:hypothetical protein
VASLRSEDLFGGGAEFHFLLTAQDGAPILVIRYRHAALDTDARALDRLTLSTKQLLQK